MHFPILLPSKLALLPLLLPLLLLLLQVFPQSTHCQTNPVSKLSFATSFTPKGWTRYNPANFTTHVLFTDIPDAARLPAPFRAFVRRSSGFTYVHSVPQGTYTVRLGFVEILDDICAGNSRRRQFYVIVNSVRSQLVDIYANVKCYSPYTLTLTNVHVFADNILTLQTSPTASKYPPVLSNFIVLPQPAPTPSPEYSIDAGSKSEQQSLITGPTSVSSKVYKLSEISIKQSRRYSRYRYGRNFRYKIPLQPNTLYNIRLSFAEVLKSACNKNYRTFNVLARDANDRIRHSKSITVNIFAAVGCRTLYQVFIHDVAVRQSATLVVHFVAIRQSAIVSAIDVFPRSNHSVSTESPTATSSSTPSQTPPPQPVPPSPSPSVQRHPDATDHLPLKIDVGSPSAKSPQSPFHVSVLATKNKVPATKLVQSSAYQSACSAQQFQYQFQLPPGGYVITLAFAEILPQFCTTSGKRVFNVFVNGQLQLEGFDVFREAGCYRGLEKTIKHTVSVLNNHPLVIRFERVVGDALLNFLSIHSSDTLCIPESSSGILNDDHAAHALPGSYPPQLSSDSPMSYVDFDGDGYHTVRIDGTGSHTHSFDPSINLVGRITSYTWTIVSTGQIISRRSLFDFRFPLGVTRLKLMVIDNFCSTDEAETTVTVTGSLQPSIYCYFYDGLDAVPLGGTLESGPTPHFASEVSGLRFSLPDFSFANSKFAMRCNFLLETSIAMPNVAIELSTFGTGHARVYKGDDLTIDTQQSSTATTALPVGMASFEITYLRTTRAIPPRLQFSVNGVTPDDNEVFHDRRTVLPILTSLSPSEGQTSGGTTVRISGYGLYQPLDAFFGTMKFKPLQNGASHTEFLIITAAAPAGPVDVFVKSPTGKKSNVLTYTYGSSCDSVSFDVRALTSRKGIATFQHVPTSVEIWQDQKIYMGCIDGSVQVMGYDRETLHVTSHCYSKPLVDERFKNPLGAPAERSVLGIAFHPADKLPRAYVSTSTLFAHSRQRIALSDKRAWMNGAVDRLKPGSDTEDKKVCLVHDRTIVRNLPVSNHDHSVNSIIIDQNGNLLIGVGSMTNAGLPGYKLGSWWENDISAAVLMVPLSNPDFNGRLTYKNGKEQYRARKRKGDVEVYASGTRNPFGMTMTSSGNIYATDQGMNCAFGQIAGNCNHFDKATVAAWNKSAPEDWPGGVKPETGACGTSATRPDKILLVEKGAFYGHPNLARAPTECAWIDPFSDRTAAGKDPPTSYRSSLALVPSSVTGIHEYRGNHFCGKLRGDLLLSAYKGGVTYRMTVVHDKVLVDPYQLIKEGGLSFVENAHGELIFPQYQKKNIHVLTPRVTRSTQLSITGLAPFRHGLKGGTLLTIGGTGFVTGITASIDGKTCAIRYWTSVELQCVVPAMSSGGPYDVSVKVEKTEVVLKNAVLYMNV